jgi:hypothetical protein
MCCLCLQECNISDLMADNNGWSASPIGNDVWSAKNRLFSDYSDVSARYDQALQAFAELKHRRHLCRNNNCHQTELLEANAIDTDDDLSHVSIEAALAGIGEGKPSHTSRLSPSCSPLDLSMAGYDETANDTLLKTPAGFYDRMLPFSGPSIPPLFERDETSFSDVTRSRCSSPESLSGSSCNDDALSTSSEAHLQKFEEWPVVEETKITSSTLCQSPVAVTDRMHCVRDTCQSEQKQISDDESRLCDRVVCSVLSHVISDDFNGDSSLLDSCIDVETSSVGDKSIVSDRSCTSSPDGQSRLNPLAPAFRVKANGQSKSVHMGKVQSSPIAAVCSPISFTYAPQQAANSVAWNYYPAYVTTRQTSSSSSSRKAKPASVMHFTPLRGKFL